MPTTTARPPAHDLPIAGLVPLSTVDWPGRLVATVFVQGCPWRCTYCHNTDLLDCAKSGVIGFSDVTALLAKRRGLLDGVVFTGGEATRHPALPAAMTGVREAGFEVGLHTGGAYPRRLAEIREQLTWVGFDVKGLPEDYPSVVGVGESLGERAWQALSELLAGAAPPEVEARLTVYPGSHSPESVRECARRALALGAGTFALQEARTADGARPLRLPVARDAEILEFAELAELVREVAGERAIIRSAKD